MDKFIRKIESIICILPYTEEILFNLQVHPIISTMTGPKGGSQAVKRALSSGARIKCFVIPCNLRALCRGRFILGRYDRIQLQN